MDNIKKLILLFGDLIILYLSLIITLLIRYGADFTQRLGAHLGPFSVVFILWILIFYLSDLYRYKAFREVSALFRTIALAIIIAGTLSIIAFYLFNEFFKLTPKTNLLIFSAVFLGLNYLWRNTTLNTLRAGGMNVLILGDSPLIKDTIQYLKENPQAGYRVSEWLIKTEEISFDEISKIISREHVNLVVIPYDLTKDFWGLRLTYKLLPLEVNLINFWDFYESVFEKVPIEELKENWFIENIVARRPFYDGTKRITEFLLSLILSIILLPIVFLIALLIKLTSPGPIIFKQERVGKNSKLFTLYKFRTMYNQTDNGPLWGATDKDRRVTGLGKILRFTHLDEIPQLINVLKSEISFIGPRPERIELAEQYKNLPYYEIRHIIKPGVTGWAQINYKPSASLKEAQEKLCYDIFYIKNRSLFLDTMIFLKTIRYVFTPPAKRI